MALKPIYSFDGKRWIPISRAANLLATNTATVKKMMGDGRLEWSQDPRGLTLLVEEAGVLRLRVERAVPDREIARRADAPVLTADRRGRSMRAVASSTPPAGSGRGVGVFERTWDPAHEPLPVSGREPEPPKPQD